jgi:hypothetical protein
MTQPDPNASGSQDPEYDTRAIRAQEEERRRQNRTLFSQSPSPQVDALRGPELERQRQRQEW